MKVFQNNVALLGQLYISMQSRDGDLNEFFSHETQSYPPSLSDFGKLHLPGTKSQLIPCILPDEQPEQPRMSDCKILDDAVVFHWLTTRTVNTLYAYAHEVFIPYLFTQL